MCQIRRCPVCPIVSCLPAFSQPGSWRPHPIPAYRRLRLPFTLAPALRGQPGPMDPRRPLWRACRRLHAAADRRGPSVVLPGARRVDIGLTAPAQSAEIETLDRLPTRTNYFVGRRDRWRTGIASYARVRYKAVYPGIDVVYYGNQNDLEYDFVLAPGADPRAIRLKVTGPAASASPRGRSGSRNRRPAHPAKEAAGIPAGGGWLRPPRNCGSLRDPGTIPWACA